MGRGARVRWSSQGNPPRDCEHGNLTRTVADRCGRQDCANNRNDYRTIRTGRFFPLSLFAFWNAAGQNPVPRSTNHFRKELHTRGIAELAARVPAAILCQSVQAELPARWPQSWLREPLASRRLANAKRRRGPRLAG